MANARVGGILEVKADGVTYNAKGNFTYNLGKGKKRGSSRGRCGSWLQRNAASSLR